MYGCGEFGYGNSSTSYIEHTWGNLKQVNICKKNNIDKLKIFERILEAVYDILSYDFYSYEELISFDNYDE